MPRPTTKSQLLSEIEKERTALENYLATLPDDRKVAPGVVGAWSVKDVLAHLLEWERMCLRWCQAGKENRVPHLPAEGFKWNQMPQLNQQIYEHYREMPLTEVLEQFETIHRDMMQMIETMTEVAMCTPGYYAWTNKNAVLTYLVSATSSHFRWARTEIRKGLK